MIVKNMREYRKYYKKYVRGLDNRNENFIGHTFKIDNNNHFGFFDIKS